MSHDTPQSLSRIAWLACALLLGFAARARTAPPLPPMHAWAVIHAGPQVYYVDADKDGARYQRMLKHQFGGPISLYVEEQETAQGKLKTVKAPSHAALFCDGAGDDWACRIVVNKGSGGNFSVSVNINGKQPAIAPTLLAPAERRPEGIQRAVWAVVVNLGLKEKYWARAAGVLQQALDPKRNKNAAGLRAADATQMSALFSGILADLVKPDSPDKKIEKKMVQYLIANSPKAAAPPRPIVPKAHGAPVGPAAGKPEDKKKAEDNAINTLALLLKQRQPQADLAGRIMAYLKAPQGAAAFIELPQARREAGLKMLSGAVSAWVTRAAKTAQGRGKEAGLYYVLGDSPKAWFAGHPVLDALAKPNAALPDFDRKMAIFTVGGAKRAPANAGPFKGDMAWPAAMLETATEFARQAINDRRLAPQVKASVDTHDQGLPVPGGPGAPGGGLKRGFSARGFNVADLYEKGGVTQFWNIDGTEPPKHLISIRVYSKVSSWGPPPRISDRIGIFDINPDEFKHPSPVHHLVGQYFSLNQTGDSTFQLGSGKSGTFKLSMGADESISLVPVDSQSKEPISDPLTTSISALFAARKGLAASEGYYEKINGQGFRVIGQGGERGALLYYAVGADGRPLSDDPSLIAQVNEVSDGRTQPLSGDRPLGYVGMKADGKTPQAYGLAWNNETKTFDPKEIDSDALGDAPGASSTTVASSDGAPADKGTTADTDDDKGGAGKAGGGKAKKEEAGNGADVGGELAHCDYKEKPTDYPDAVWYHKPAAGWGHGWQFYTPQVPLNPKTNAVDYTMANATYICVYGKYMLFLSQGLVADGDISVEGDKDILDIRTAVPDADIKTKNLFIKPELLQKGLKVEGRTLVYGGGLRRPITSTVVPSTEYFIKLRDLKKLLQLWGDRSSVFAAGVKKVAWVSRNREWESAEASEAFTVYWRPQETRQEALADITEALKKFIPHVADENYCLKDGSLRPELADYLDDVLKNPGAKKWLNVQDSSQKDDPGFTPPSVAFHCLNTNDSADWWVVASAPPSWKHIGRLKAVPQDDGTTILKTAP